MKLRKKDQKTTISLTKNWRKKRQKTTKKNDEKTTISFEIKTTKKQAFINLKNDLNDGN